jgi:hypothetical protein
MVRSLRRRREAGGNDQPATRALCTRAVHKVTADQRNSLSGKSHLPCTEATPCEHPLITANPYPSSWRRGMPWEALCLHARYGPVTTDPFGVRLRSLSDPMAKVGHGKSEAGARRGLS